MKSEKTTCKLSDVIDLIGGGTPKTGNPEYWHGEIPWLSVKDFNSDDRYVYSTEKTITRKGLDNSSTKLLERDDIIISARGTVGELAMIPYPMAFNQSCFGIRGKKEFVIQSYLYYLLKDRIRLLKKQAHGSVFDTITRDTFASVEVNLPPTDEQQKIADILVSLDNRIAENRAINHHLEQMAQAIFKSWFVDFEPWGGVMPTIWATGSLIEIANYLNGLAMQHFRPVDGEAGLPVLKIKELRQGICDSSSELCSSDICSDYIVHDGDVVFSWSGSLLVDFWCGGDCGLNQHLFKVTSTKYDKWFYYCWTFHHLAQFVAIAADKATTMGHIKREALANAKVLIPDEESYRKIGAILAPLYNQLITNRVANRQLSLLRDFLLPRLMSGEISVLEVSHE
jgi:type I restriction enzyme S subunit